MRYQKTILILSFILCAIGLIGMLGFNDIELSARAQMFSELPILLILVSAIIIAPIFEEIFFRLVLAKIKSKAIKYFSVIGFLSSLFLNSKIINIITVVVLVIAVLSNNQIIEKYRIYVLLFFTSLLFSVFHISGDYDVNVNFFFILYYLGLGGLLGVVAFRFGLKYSILTHFLFNGILTFTMWSPVVSPTPAISANTDFIKVEMTSNSRKISIGGNSYFMPDSVIIKNKTPQKIAYNLLNSKGTLKYIKENTIEKFSLKAYPNKPNLNLKNQILQFLEKQNIVNVDTFERKQKYYHFSLKNSYVDNDYHNTRGKISGIAQLITYAYKKYKIVIKYSGIDKKCNKGCYFEIHEDWSLEEFLNTLKEKYNIEITEKKGLIRVYEIN